MPRPTERTVPPVMAAASKALNTLFIAALPV